jgi:peptidoglycan lytic transglycosylase
VPAPSPSEPLRRGDEQRRGGTPDDAAKRFVDTAKRYPVLADYVLYFRARAAVADGRPGEAVDLAREVRSAVPDSVWRGRAALLAGSLLRGRDPDAARTELAIASDALAHGSPRWARATVLLAELDDRRGDPVAALERARDVRRSAPRTLAARRARRLADRIRSAHPELPVDPVDEAETRLREGDASGARAEADRALESGATPAGRARALWARAQAEHALALPVAETTCRTLASEHPNDPLAPRALGVAAGWRWNADDDVGALRLFELILRRFPDSPQAAEALYATGRIAQEAGRWDDAARSYASLAARFPQSELAAEARWRAGWTRWLAGQIAAAARGFARAADASQDGGRPAADYWHARALERLGRENEARERFARLADDHRTSYYAGLAEQRLGRNPPGGTPPETVAVPPFPGELAGVHAERARVLAGLGLQRFARRELDAVAASEAPRSALVDGYRAVGAVAPALRLAEMLRPRNTVPDTLAEALYPLGFWDVVHPAARAHDVDPLLVTAVIRQESLFDPDAVSPAGARGLMQIMPATARQLAPAGAPAPLHDVGSNVGLGCALLARLLARYDGSLVKAIAAYNAGEDAVAKWERRYGERPADEFVELISFRETRDYVKAVLRNYRVYRLLYAASPSTTSPGSPPNAPFDMTTTTSPGRAVETR